MDGLIAYALAKKYTDEVGRSIVDAGFKTQVEQDRSILQTTGHEKILYFIPKTTAKPSDGYDEYVYSNNAWEQVGVTDVDLSNYATKEWTLEQIENFEKTDISGAVVTLNQSVYIYDGTSKAPSVTSVVINGQTLIAGTDYTVIANPATNAGQYVVIVNGMGNYKGTVTTAWEITKAQATISGDDSITISGLDDTVTKTYTTDGDGAFSFTITGNIATISNVSGEVTITPTALGSSTMTVTLSEGANYLGATKTVPVEIVKPVTVFGVMWDYSLSSPQLARLTPQTDPLSVVTTVPSQEPTACVGNDGNGQSDFDNYMPWKGMQRYNYIDGQIVDFIGYQSGETFVYIPDFWSKVVDDSTNHKMYFYISSSELTGFTKHLGSGRYVGRYACDSNFLSNSGQVVNVSKNLGDFRTGITSIDIKHFQFDVHTKAALQLLYLEEFANFNSQLVIGNGYVDAIAAHQTGFTDILTHHTGRSSNINDQCQIQYRWIEDLWGNVWNFLDGVLINDNKVYICQSVNDYSSSLTSDYIEIGNIYETNGFITKLYAANSAYLIPENATGTDSTFVCDYLYSNSGLRVVAAGGGYANSSRGGMFSMDCSNSATQIALHLGSRSILILGGDS